MTVVICTYRPRINVLKDALDRILEELSTVNKISVLVVVNEEGYLSTLDEVVGQYPTVQFRECAQSGLLNARLYAIRNTDDDILFVDDDNLLGNGYLNRLHQFITMNKNIGIVGCGTLTLPSEYEVPNSIKPLLSAVAIRSLARTVWTNVPFAVDPPYGAGMFVRRTVLVGYLHFFEHLPAPSQIGRSPVSLSGYEDFIFMFVSCKLGLGYSVNKDLEITHVVDPNRLQPSYYLRPLVSMETGAWECDRLAQSIYEQYFTARLRAEKSKLYACIHLLKELRNIVATICKIPIQRESFFPLLCRLYCSLASIRTAKRILLTGSS